MVKFATQLLIILFISISTTAGAVIEIQGINLAYPQSGIVQVILSSKERFEYKYFKLNKNIAANKPARFVVDAIDSKPRFYLDDNFQKQFDQDPILQKIRVGKHHQGFTRIVVDLRKEAVVNVEENLTSSGGFQLILTVRANNNQLTKIINQTTVSTNKESKPKSQNQTTNKSTLNRPFKVVIDAGHGGRDPGAVSADKSIFEKNITYAISSKIGRLLSTDPNYQVKLTRNSDILHPLKKRVQIAHENKADMFISIHADAFPLSSKIHGASVYILSKDRASNQITKLLAEKENEVDRIYKINGIEDIKDPEAKFIVRDLQVKSVTSASERLAKILIDQIGRVKTVFDESVHKGPFVVLSSSYIPSVLVEVGFLTNPEEAASLTQPAEQNRIASAIVNGIKIYSKRFLTNHGNSTNAVKNGNKKIPVDITPIAKEINQLTNQVDNISQEPEPSPSVPTSKDILTPELKKAIEAATEIENPILITPETEAIDKKYNEIIADPESKAKQNLLDKLKDPNTTQTVNAETHTVAPGETFLSISQKYNVSEAALKEANAQFQEIIFPGDILDIPSQ